MADKKLVVKTAEKTNIMEFDANEIDAILNVLKYYDKKSSFVKFGLLSSNTEESKYAFNFDFDRDYTFSSTIQKSKLSHKFKSVANNEDVLNVLWNIKHLINAFEFVKNSNKLYRRHCDDNVYQIKIEKNTTMYISNKDNDFNYIVCPIR
ncbi:hypothetical protein [Staphylococcus pseudintermedius]|uniref:hypothetical protein n=1 Tax=Staphylococcus pseudintermedius TaxID=283734 RepID=UPI0028FD5CF5|nr:hypothetical protein [Staphylococcus pseudintermedius]MDU0384098.1 hypothetical protein [Staphylococcus pseudintermedius]